MAEEDLTQKMTPEMRYYYRNREEKIAKDLARYHSNPEVIAKREERERFLKIVGMKHSQEEILIGAEKLDEIGLELCKVEKEIVEGLGLRQSRRKGDWKVANTIDLIKVVLESWGCGIIESSYKQKRKSGKVLREYQIEINKNNSIWSKLVNYNTNYEINLINL
jgi:hypothetical protein